MSIFGEKKKRKQYFIVFFVAIVLVVAFLFYFLLRSASIREGNLSPSEKQAVSPTPKPLDKYAFEALRTRASSGYTIRFGQLQEETSDYSVYPFTFTSDGKKVSGLAHIPNGIGPYPVIVQYRGFVSGDIYEPGVGTKHSAEVLAKNRFISLAPDFLGFGTSDKAVNDAMESRFQNYTTAIDLLNALPTLNNALKRIGKTQADAVHVGIWGHSNGGHIALVVLELTGKRYPTVLWAPVSKPFPYSLFYYMNRSSDGGKILRKIIADFEQYYDSDHYSLTNYIEWIHGPIELHQGTDDGSVPEWWSSDFVDLLKKHNKTVTYFTYPGENHNFSKGSWNLVMRRTVDFYTAAFNAK